MPRSYLRHPHLHGDTLVLVAEDDVWTLTERERRAMGIRPLPASLDEAIRTMEESDFVAEVLGEHVFDFVLRNKHNEWAAYRDQVTEFEIKQDLRRL